MTDAKPLTADGFKHFVNRAWNEFRSRKHQGQALVLVRPEFFDVVLAQVDALTKRAEAAEADNVKLRAFCDKVRCASFGNNLKETQRTLLEFMKEANALCETTLKDTTP